MWPRTDFLELLGIAHPVIQAPMSGFTPPQLAAAVSNAGGLGSIGCAGLPPALLREQVASLRHATNRPFNLNFFVHARPHASPEMTAGAQAKLAPYFKEFALGAVPEPKEPFPTFDAERLELSLSSGRVSSAFILACRLPRRCGGSKMRARSFSAQPPQWARPDGSRQAVSTR